VILEPLLQGAGGMAMVRPAFLQAVQRLVRQAGALLIADEVLTGFGRSGSLFASQRAGLAPDLMALSKGLTGGFLPMGVTLAREALYEGFIGTDPSLTLFHGHSFTANPLGCASALASLDLLEARPECYQGMEARLKPGLVALAGHPKVLCPRLLGCAAAFDLAVDEPGYLNGVGQRLQQLLQQQGVFLRPLGSVVYLFPPLATTDEQLDQCFKAIAWALDQL
jgi:adenosylmethionine-8-amino-7-oxononanoate aminotransferase